MKKYFQRTINIKIINNTSKENIFWLRNFPSVKLVQSGFNSFISIHKFILKDVIC